MKAAIREAKKAWALGEVPIGCVIVRGGKIIARGYNRRTTDKNVLAHAEISAIKKACRKTGDWRLEECVLFVTLEPCPISIDSLPSFTNIIFCTISFSNIIISSFFETIGIKLVNT